MENALEFKFRFLLCFSLCGEEGYNNKVHSFEFGFEVPGKYMGGKFKDRRSLLKFNGGLEKKSV